MSENSERKGMVWARWRVDLELRDSGEVLRKRYADYDETYALQRLDDERRALVRAALAGYGDSVRNVDYAFADADAVLDRYDEEVEGE